jgi:hypothetical protein
MPGLNRKKGADLLALSAPRVSLLEGNPSATEMEDANHAARQTT